VKVPDRVYRIGTRTYMINRRVMHGSAHRYWHQVFNTQARVPWLSLIVCVIGIYLHWKYYGFISNEDHTEILSEQLRQRIEEISR
jgi:hypothetical protein